MLIPPVLGLNQKTLLELGCSTLCFDVINLRKYCLGQMFGSWDMVLGEKGEKIEQEQRECR